MKLTDEQRDWILVETLAIKLYEHDHSTSLVEPEYYDPWIKLHPKDREAYRRLARQVDPLPGEEPEEEPAL